MIEPHFATPKKRKTPPKNAHLYHYGFNGKEKVDEMFGEGDAYDYGMRAYDARVGRFMSVDVIFFRFAYYSPYQFGGCNPIRFIDLDGLEPGEPFTNANEAALNFTSLYGAFSIQENREFSASIYKFVGNDGKEYYTYNIPIKGGKAGAPINLPKKKEGKLVASIHTHGAYDPNFNNNEFSKGTPSEPADREVAQEEGVPALVATPKGTLLIYEPISGEEDVLSTNAPSDPNDPDVLFKGNSVIKEGATKSERRKERINSIKINSINRKIFNKTYKANLKKRISQKSSTPK